MRYLIVGTVLLVGVLVVIGAHRRWSWLVDPPEELWPFYSQAFLKRFFSARVLVTVTYAIGFMLVGASALLIYFAIVAE